MSEAMLYEDYLRQQVDRGEFGVCIIPANIATGIAEYLEMHRNDATVVRCKDCKHRFKDGDNVIFNRCELNHDSVMPDGWYCADGERRDDDADK